MLLRLILRYRRTAILSTALLLSFLFLTIQARQESLVVGFTKKALLLSTSPFLKLSSLMASTVSSLWKGYVDLRGLHWENLRLKEEIERLHNRLDALQEAALENERLRSLLDLQGRVPTRAIAARVIGNDATNWFKTLLIDKGFKAGIRRNMPVVAPEGLVGRVVEVTALSSKVQFITDPLSAVGAIIQRSRVTAVAVGHPRAVLRLKYLPLTADVVAGDRAITSGMGGVFPKGIYIGEVTWTKRPSGAIFQEAEVAPGVDFSRLEEVMVLTETSPEERQ